MRAILAVSIFCLMLTGCNDDSSVFGLKIGGSEKQLREQATVIKEDLIPSKVRYLELVVKSVPESDLGDDAKYTVSAIDGRIIGVRASRQDAEDKYYSSMIAYAKNKMGDPIATEEGITNKDAVASIPIGCAKNSSCPNPKYAAFRKGTLNALVSGGAGSTDIIFYDDEIKKAFE